MKRHVKILQSPLFGRGQIVSVGTFERGHSPVGPHGSAHAVDRAKTVSKGAEQGTDSELYAWN